MLESILKFFECKKKNLDFATKLFSTKIRKKEKPLKTAYRSTTKKKKAPVNSGPNQKQIDAILDKISKSGYDTLTKAEKEFLFKQGKR